MAIFLRLVTAYCGAVLTLLYCPDSRADGSADSLETCPLKVKSLEAWDQHFAPTLGGVRRLEKWYNYGECFEVLDPTTTPVDELQHFRVTPEKHTHWIHFRPDNLGYLHLVPSVYAELAFLLKKLEPTGIPIVLQISSDGGWVEVAEALLELFDKANTPVILVIDDQGHCFSACKILTSGWSPSLVHSQVLFGFHGASRGGELSSSGTQYFIGLLLSLGVRSDFLESWQRRGYFSTQNYTYHKAHELQGSGLFSNLYGSPSDLYEYISHLHVRSEK